VRVATDVQRAIAQAADLVAVVRDTAGLTRPPDPRPALPARRPADGLDPMALPLAGISAVAAVACVAIGGILGIAGVVLLLLSVLLVARQAARAAQWRSARHRHRQAYRTSLRDPYDRFRVEAVHEGEWLVLRLRRFSPSRLRRDLYAAQTCCEERFGPDDDIAAFERLAELQAEAEDREAAARDAHRRAARAREHLLGHHVIQ